MRVLSCLILFVFSLTAGATEPYSIVHIDSTHLDIKSQKRLTIDHYHELEIRSEKHRNKASIFLHTDQFTEVEDLYIQVIDDQGEVEEYYITDFKDVSSDRGTEISDSRVLVWRPEIRTYPYRLRYYYQIKNKGTLFLPGWSGQNRFNQLVKNVAMTVEMPAELEIRTKSRHFKKTTLRSAKKHKKYSWELDQAYYGEDYEPFSSALKTDAPQLRLALNAFDWDGYEGSMASWKDFGQWSYNLLHEAEPLPEDIREKIRRKFGDIADPRERAKAVYHWMQDRSRYISIQLGIGGWMPMDAEDVYNYSYGDCKALSFFTQQALEAVDIPSYYTLIYSNRHYDEVDPDFCSNSFNHAILQVPIAGDTCWLECTSKYTPFDYAGRSTAGHLGLVVRDQESYLTTIDDYNMEESEIYLRSSLKYNSTGSSSSQHEIEFSKLDFDAHLFLSLITEDERQEWLSTQLHDSAPHFSGIKVSKDEQSRLIKLKAQVQSGDVFSELGNYLVVEPLRLKSDLPSLPENIQRRSPVVFDFASLLNYEVEIEIPEGYQLKSTPQDQAAESSFGSFELTYLSSRDKLSVKYQARLKKQSIPASEYNELRLFLQDMRLAIQKKIVFEKV